MSSKENVSRTKMAFKNVIFNFGYQFVNTFANIIVPPLIIGYFGSVINGLVSTIKQIINYIQIVGSGISESTIVSLYKPLLENNEKKISSIYNATRNSFNKAGLIFSICAIILSFVYPLIIKEDLNYFSIVFLILSLCIAGASEFFLLGKYRTLLIADQKQYIVNIAQIIGLFLSTAFTVLLINLGVNIVIVQLVSSILYLMRILVLFIYVRKKYTYLNPNIKPDYSAISKRKDAMVHQIASLIIFGSQTLLIANYCGLKEASVYSVYALIFTGINTILSTFSSAMVAGMGNLIVSSDKEKVNKVYNIYEYGYYILVFVFYLVTFIMCLPFIKLYTSSSVDANYIHFDFVILFSIMGILNCLRTPPATVINAKGHYKETKYRALIEMTICLVGEIFLVGNYKVIGVLIATILAYLYRTIDVIIYSNRIILSRNVFETLKKILMNISIFILFCYFSTKIEFNINNYIEWSIYAGVIFVISSLIFVAFNYFYSRSTMKELINYLLTVIRRKNGSQKNIIKKKI